MQCYLESDCSVNVEIVFTALLGGFNQFLKNLRYVFVCTWVTLYDCSPVYFISIPIACETGIIQGNWILVQLAYSHCQSLPHPLIWVPPCASEQSNKE